MKISLLLLTSLFLCTILSAQKSWTCILSTNTGKQRGTLAEVRDSAVLLQTKKGTEVYSFREIRRFKFVRTDNEPGQRLKGAVIGGIAGAVITSSILTSRVGNAPPRAMAGVVGGVYGGLLGLLTGAITAPLFHELLFAKKIRVLHTPEFYRSLPALLHSYVLTR